MQPVTEAVNIAIGAHNSIMDDFLSGASLEVKEKNGKAAWLYTSEMFHDATHDSIANQEILKPGHVTATVVSDDANASKGSVYSNTECARLCALQVEFVSVRQRQCQ